MEYVRDLLLKCIESEVRGSEVSLSEESKKIQSQPPKSEGRPILLFRSLLVGKFHFGIFVSRFLVQTRTRIARGRRGVLYFHFGNRLLVFGCSGEWSSDTLWWYLREPELISFEVFKHLTKEFTGSTYCERRTIGNE